MKRTLIFLFMLQSIACLAGSGIAVEPIRFVDDRFEDFSAGWSDDGGQNLYVARDGTLRTINRFDLNDDGHLDLIFNCTHNTYQMLPATVGSVDKQRQTKSVDLGFEGSQQAVIDDLNRDGYADVVVCPNGIGVHHDRRFVTIAWGGADGWSSNRINSPLPMNAAAAVETCDLNGDDWPDICILGASRWQVNQPDGRIVRVYWGSAAGYSVTDLTDLGVPSALQIAAGDFDGDQHRDLAVLRTDGKLSLFWSRAGSKWTADDNRTDQPVDAKNVACLASSDGSTDGRADLIVGCHDSQVLLLTAMARGREAKVSRIPALPATHITSADLDRDGYMDLTLAHFDQARAAGGEQAGASQNVRDSLTILWGSATDSWQTRTSIEVPLAAATAAGDLDADGNLDLAIAVHQGETTFAGESLVYFGDGRRGFQRGANGFRSSGTLDVVIAPAEKELPARVVLCNSIGGELDEAVPLHLYWGGQHGFEPDRVWKIPFHSGYEASAADLNADGFADLIALNSGHSGAHAHVDSTLGANIFWGTKAGLERSTERTVLHEHFLGTSSVADLNRDGWLDLVLEPFGPEKAGDKEQLFIYYGGPDGYPRLRRVSLVLDGYAQEHAIADFNKDRWLDIAVTTRTLDCIRILWGSPEGFDTAHEQRLKVSGPVGVDAADFNGDGWLDALVGSYNDPISGHRDMGLVLFWGSPQGFQHSNAQWLPGFSPLGRTVADFDGDGFLDLVSPQHSGELTREDLACHIYWGGREGFGTRRRTTLFCDSVNDSMAGDFNGDGLIDLAMNGHTRHGDHRAFSRVFYNDGTRFANPRVQVLQTNGPHLIWATDVGNIYHRKYQHTFVSRVFQWEQPLRAAKLVATCDPNNSQPVKLQFRTAAEQANLESAPWLDVDEKSQTVAIASSARFGQYRLTLISDNGDRYPVVDRVDLEFK